MALQPGAVLGDYEVVAAIGAGGMGEVYRARDRKLGREVALKVLPDALAADADRLARFGREARVLASLNHPSIATLHGFFTATPVPGGSRGRSPESPQAASPESEKAGETSFLVMELVEGETLEDRIARGPLPLAEACRLFVQIAEGLEAAHEKGIVHRDLKPANVKLSPRGGAGAGRVKILDFGLAKALDVEAASGELSHSPTLTYAATRRGEILGTAAYMSPEQARGEEVDKRTDVWAYGACLYEALSGRTAFRRQTASHTLVAILDHEPDWQRVPEEVPGAVRRLLHRCLRKDPRDRLHDIADARIVLREVLEGLSGASTAPAASSDGAPGLASDAARRPRRRSLAALAGAFVVGATVATVGLLATRSEPAPEARGVRRLNVTLPPDLPLQVTDRILAQHGMALSPDGDWLAYVAATDSGSRVVTRRLDSFEFSVVPGSEGAHTVFFSPDGRWIGFGSPTQGKLLKAPIDGRPARQVANLAGATLLGASWADDGFIYLGGGGAIWRVPAAGGEPEEVSVLLEGEAWRGFPDVLPGAKALLLNAGTGPGSAELITVRARALVSGEETVVAERSGMARYVASGHLLLPQTGRMMAVPFDPKSLTVTGPAVDVTEPGMIDPAVEEIAPVMYACADDGTLVFAPVSIATGGLSVLVVDRSGASQPLGIPLTPQNQLVRLSPDGSRLAAVQLHAGGNMDVWVHDLAHRTALRLTFSLEWDEQPLWTSDGREVTYSRFGNDIVRKAASGVGDETVILGGDDGFAMGADWAPGGNTLLVMKNDPETGWDLWTVDGGSGTERELLVTPSDELMPEVSPDGRWLVYESDESGRREVYVQPWPAMDGKWQISTQGGRVPRWNPQGGEIFFMNEGGLYGVEVTAEAGAGLRVGPPRLLFQDPSYDLEFPYFDPFPDGQRFVVVATPAAQTRGEIVVVENWFEELRRKAPPVTQR